MPGGQPQPAGHLLEPHLAAVLVGAGGGERPARHARGSRGLDPALGARAAAGPRVRPRAPLGLAVRVEHRALRADRALGDEAVVAAELRHARTSESSGLTPCPRCGPRSSPTFTSAAWPAPTSRATARSASALVEAVADADRLVLLGDVIELRERPLAEALEVARPVFEELGARARRAGRSCSCRATTTTRFAEPVARAAAARRRRAADRDGVAGRARRRRAGPDRRLDAGRGAHARLPGPASARRRLRHPRPLPRPPPDDPAARVDRGVGDGARDRARQGSPRRPPTTRRSWRPMYAFYAGLAQGASPASLARGGSLSRDVWRRVAAPQDGRARSDRGRFLLGRVTIPGAVAALNGLGLGPVPRHAHRRGAAPRRPAGHGARGRGARARAPST